MKKIFLLLFVLPAILMGQPLSMSPLNDMGSISIENRILLKLHNKAITVRDLVRKLDLIFYRQYPDLASSDMARYQFYMSSWEPVLQLVIDEELILADAEEKKIPLNDGEVRQEMERLFGPNVVLTLDSLHMTFEEGFALLRRELMVQKATSAFVQSKAVASVTPGAVKRAYQETLTAAAPENRYTYRILTIRGEEEEKVKEFSDQVYQKLLSGQAVEEIKVEGCQLTLSERYNRGQDEIALAHLEVLKTLSAKGVSTPAVQPVKGGGYSYRLFLLEEFQKGEHPTLASSEGYLKQKLMQEAYLFHNEQYRSKLRHHYDITENYIASFTPQEFKPFAMR